jgi:hypothetical protein
VKTTLLKIALLLLGVVALHTGAAAQTTSANVVLELFTSQGCSSCPPADALLASYVKRDDVIALSVAVDYWDRLGWKDTFASREHTNRQRDYARARGDGQVYTPQVVINGKFHVVGSSRSAIDGAIAMAKTAPRESQVPLRVHFEHNALIVQVGGAPAGAAISTARLLLAVVQDAGTVSIRRGENANRIVTYYNIVRGLKTIGAWAGTPSTLRVSKSEFSVAGTQSLVVLLQNGIGGPIMNAAQIRIAGQSKCLLLPTLLQALLQDLDNFEKQDDQPKGSLWAGTHTPDGRS